MISGLFLKFKITSYSGGLQYIGLTSRPVIGYTSKYVKSRTEKTSLTFLQKDCDMGEEPEKDSLEKDHCEKVTYVAEDKSIATRCTGNCKLIFHFSLVHSCTV